MMEMSCRWWSICYLLFFCHGAEGQLQWIVKEKVTDYGQDLTLFCPIGNCCSDLAGWFVGPKTIFMDVKRFSNDSKVKYHGTYDTDGFGVVIRNLSEADLNVTYRCIYEFNQSTPKYLFHGDVFKEKINVDEFCYNTRSPNQCKDPMSSCTEVVSGDYKCSCNPGYYNNGGTCVPDKDEEDNTETIPLFVVPIVILVGAIIGAIIGIIMYRKTKKIRKQRGINEEMGLLNDLENQQDLKEDTEKERTETLLAMLKTFTSQSSSTEVILLFREVKSAMIKADKEQKKQLETFIIENHFFYY